MSVVPVCGDRHQREDSGRRQLLAMHELRGSVEQRPIAAGSLWRAAVALTRTELIRELQELIEALDRRVPRMERSGETEIARDAAALKVRALKRLAELEKEPA